MTAQTLLPAIAGSWRTGQLQLVFLREDWSWAEDLHSFEPSLALHPTYEEDHAKENKAEDGRTPAGVYVALCPVIPRCWRIELGTVHTWLVVIVELTVGVAVAWIFVVCVFRLLH